MRKNELIKSTATINRTKEARNTDARVRFCVKCRRLTKNGRGTVEWKCIKCGKIMSKENRIGQYFCGRDCREGGRAAYSLKIYKIKRLAAEIVKQGGIDKYKCKITI